MIRMILHFCRSFWTFLFREWVGYRRPEVSALTEADVLLRQEAEQRLHRLLKKEGSYVDTYVDVFGRRKEKK